jgi:hypothetical protein
MNKELCKIIQKIVLPQVQVIHPPPKMPSSVNHTNFLDRSKILKSATVRLLFNMLKTTYSVAITVSTSYWHTLPSISA